MYITITTTTIISITTDRTLKRFGLGQRYTALDRIRVLRQGSDYKFLRQMHIAHENHTQALS